MPNLNKHLYHVLSWAAFIELLADGIHTTLQLHELSGLNANTVRKTIRILHRRKRVFIAAWFPDAIGRMTLAGYRLGSFPDVPRPMPRTATQRSALRARRRNFDQSDITKESVVNLYQVTYTIDDKTHEEFASSDAGAAKIRARVKKLGKVVGTVEVEVQPTRAGIIELLNKLMAHESYVPATVASKLTDD